MSDDTLETASDAYVYFYPIVENLKTFFFSSVWPHTASYRGPVNQFSHATQLVDWRFSNVVSPNNDTLYSSAWLDLEEQPIVLSLPDVPSAPNNKKRYYSMQIVDGYTFNMRIISPRTTGSWEAVSYLITGPSYRGPFPSQFDDNHIIRSTSRFTFVLGRTGVDGADDIPNVHNIQQGYTLTPLQDFTEASDNSNVKKSDASLPLFPFINKAELASNTPEAQLFFSYANFIMQYIHIEAYETELFNRFSNLSIGPGMIFNGQHMSILQYKAITAGIAAGSKKIDLAPLIEKFGNRENGWMAVINPPMFGPESVLKQKYLTRAFAARFGLYGADPQEAIYPGTNQDQDNDTLDSTKHNYTLTFKADKIPQVKDGGFWSITIYRMPEQLLVHNPIDRYSIGDRTPGLVYDANGALTLYIQKNKPSDDAMVSNWLPAPDPDYGGYDSGLFKLVMRIYWPTQEAIDGPYMPPGVIKADNIINKL